MTKLPIREWIGNVPQFPIGVYAVIAEVTLLPKVSARIHTERIGYGYGYVSTTICLTSASLSRCQNLLPKYSKRYTNVESDDNYIAAKEITEKICNLPVGEKLWPNYLDHPIRNASRVNIVKFTNKMNKGTAKVEGSMSETPKNKGAAIGTRS
ncbi:hypothetical protein AgCh_031986 [Apium graveolens]